MSVRLKVRLGSFDGKCNGGRWIDPSARRGKPEVKSGVKSSGIASVGLLDCDSCVTKKRRGGGARANGNGQFAKEACQRTGAGQPGADSRERAVRRLRSVVPIPAVCGGESACW